MCRILNTSPRIIYDRIDFLYERCLEFVTDREKVLRDGMPIDRLYISVDQQDIAINWPTRLVRKNIQLKAVAAADNKSGYVFGSFVNYDSSLNVHDVETEAIATGENDKSPPFRRYARVWLLDDYLRDMVDGGVVAHPDKIENLREKILASYHIAMGKPDMESGEQPTDDLQLPHKGMQIHNEYTLYSLYLYLKQLLPGVGKLRFFFDRDTGMRAACLAAFVKEIKSHTVDAFFVMINKTMKIDQKETSVDDAYRRFRKLQFRYPDKKESDIRLMLLLQNLRKAKRIGPYKDVWIRHPLPSKAEPELESAFLTNLNQYTINHQANLHLLASEHAVNQYFMNVRRSINLLERPITSASDPGRKWYGYNAYSADQVVKLLHILRVHYNFVALKDDGSTRAMSLGIAKGPVRIEDIIYGKRYAGQAFPVLAKKLKQERYEENLFRFQNKIKTKAQRERVKRFLYNTDPSQALFLGAVIDGTDTDTKVIELALVDNQGRVLFDKLINPVRRLAKETSDRHHIYQYMVANKPTINDEAVALVGLFKDKFIISYDLKPNADLLPVPVVESAAGFEEYLDVQAARKMKKEPLLNLEQAAKKIGFGWTEAPMRALFQARALRAVWNQLAGWPEKPTTPLKKEAKTEPSTVKTEKVLSEKPGLRAKAKSPTDESGTQNGTGKAEQKGGEPKAIAAAKKTLATNQTKTVGLKTVFLDLETTGLGDSDQVIEIAIVGEGGEVLVDELVQPVGFNIKKASKVYAVNGIRREELVGKPLFEKVQGAIIKAVRDKHVVMFNEKFDLGKLTPDVRKAIGRSSCCMNRFKALGKKRNTLKFAAETAGYVWPDRAHRALADAYACRAVWHYLDTCKVPESAKRPLSGIESLEDKY